MNKEERKLIEELRVNCRKLYPMLAKFMEDERGEESEEVKPDYSGEMVGVFVGHSRWHDQGAFSVKGIPEWAYNSKVAIKLIDELRARGISCFRCDDYRSGDYQESMNFVGKVAREQRATLALELHFNAADGSADEEEYLYCSEAGKRLAACLLEAHGELDPDKKTRGIKDRSTGRGSGFLKAVPCPAVICEPFFGDNEKDWSQWGSEEGKRRLVQIYANGIEKYLKGKVRV